VETVSREQVGQEELALPPRVQVAPSRPSESRFPTPTRSTTSVNGPAEPRAVTWPETVIGADAITPWHRELDEGVGSGKVVLKMPELDAFPWAD
jgi:hypothetical protein